MPERSNGRGLGRVRAFTNGPFNRHFERNALVRYRVVLYLQGFKSSSPHFYLNVDY